MTARLPGLSPAGLDPAQRALYDDMGANEVPWAGTGGARATIVNAFEVPVPAGTQPESSTP